MPTSHKGTRANCISWCHPSSARGRTPQVPSWPTWDHLPIPRSLITVESPAQSTRYLSVRNSQIHSAYALVPAHTYPGSLNPACWAYSFCSRLIIYVVVKGIYHTMQAVVNCSSVYSGSIHSGLEWRYTPPHPQPLSTVGRGEINEGASGCPRTPGGECPATPWVASPSRGLADVARGFIRRAL